MLKIWLGYIRKARKDASVTAASLPPRSILTSTEAIAIMRR